MADGCWYPKVVHPVDQIPVAACPQPLFPPALPQLPDDSKGQVVQICTARVQARLSPLTGVLVPPLGRGIKFIYPQFTLSLVGSLRRADCIQSLCTSPCGQSMPHVYIAAPKVGVGEGGRQPPSPHALAYPTSTASPADRQAGLLANGL